MAALNPVQHLQDELTCSICCEIFQRPVILDCGHSFCRACITQCRDEADAHVSCPQCRSPSSQNNFRPNWQLANVVEKAKQLNEQVAKGAEGGQVCEEHGEALKLFCEADQKLLCMICRESQTHQAHAVAPIQEAAEQYKDLIHTQLRILRGDREKLEEQKMNRSQEHQDYQEKTKTESQKIVSEFERLRQLMKEQECLLLARLDELDRMIKKSQKETVTKLSQEISLLDSLIIEMEGKCQQPPSDFLQGIRSTLTRCMKRKLQHVVEMCPEGEKNRSDVSEQNQNLKKMLGVPPSDLEKDRGEPQGSYSKENVAMDPDTAHCRLVLSEDRKSVRWGDMEQDLPNNPERFAPWFCVLGCEGFTSGRHCWEVVVEGSGAWAMGVARESVTRKGRLIRNPEAGIWAMELFCGQYKALTSPHLTLLSLPHVPRKVCITLDYEGGLVTFSDADNNDPIFTFPPASFTGERIHPWFWVGERSLLILCP
ncbi:zinc finger protein RFP-like [Alligator sinensis]|uniref:Zinc finger protein RFP-like n=1 Tax=Alligator sinensis TaxID=38654 RepID=A0A3Q0G7G8_ALLSI|nr:zinc finger protein RFP-like [Alligator sinensis]